MISAQSRCRSFDLSRGSFRFYGSTGTTVPPCVSTRNPSALLTAFGPLVRNRFLAGAILLKPFLFSSFIYHTAAFSQPDVNEPAFVAHGFVSALG